MSPEIQKLLTDNGWIIECLSPLEIYHESTNSRATNQAAVIIGDVYYNLAHEGEEGV